MTWLLTCFAAGDEYVAEMGHMIETFRRHNPGIETLTGVVPKNGRTWQELSNHKVDWLKGVFEATAARGKDVLWVDADARFRRAIEPPTGLDIGAKRYGPEVELARWRISTGTLWLSRSLPQRFLDAWAAEPFDQFLPASNEYTLAKTLAAFPESRYQELADSMTAVCSKEIDGFTGKLEHDAAIVHWNMSRKALGRLDDWPPSEKARRQA